MNSLSKKDVAPICKKIASEHEGWQYTGDKFKYKNLKHSMPMIVPLWYFNIGAQPVVWLENKQTIKLYKQLGYTSESSYPISEKTILRPGATLETQVYRKLVYTLSEAEEYIRDFFQRGLEVIQKYYSYTDEKELLENLPLDLEANMGIGYCLSRVVLHDFDFVRRYINDEIKTVNPKYKEIEKIRELLPVWEKNYQETGSVFGKKAGKKT